MKNPYPRNQANPRHFVQVRIGGMPAPACSAIPALRLAGLRRILLLRAIRDNVDRHALIDALGIEVDQNRTRPDDLWGKSPFHPDERKASFHINPETGAWYCFSSNQGGGPLELVQLLNDGFSIYDAARWLL